MVQYNYCKLSYEKYQPIINKKTAFFFFTLSLILKFVEHINVLLF